MGIDDNVLVMMNQYLMPTSSYPTSTTKSFYLTIKPCGTVSDLLKSLALYDSTLLNLPSGPTADMTHAILKRPQRFTLGNIWSTVWCHDYWFIAFLYALKRMAKPLGWKNLKLKLICEKKKCSLTWGPGWPCNWKVERKENSYKIASSVSISSIKT